jgi:hypothetical protein
MTNLTPLITCKQLLSPSPHYAVQSVITTYSIHVQQDATLHSLFYLETALRVSGDTTTHNQERKRLYLQHLVFVTRLLLLDAVDTVVCAPDYMWWYHAKHVEQFPDKINCVTLHLV